MSLIATASAGAGHGVQASPLPLQRLQLEESFNGGGASSNAGPPGSPRSSSSHLLALRRESYGTATGLADIAENEASLSNEQAVANIAGMFPTVDESHIRELMRK